MAHRGIFWWTLRKQQSHGITNFLIQAMILMNQVFQKEQVILHRLYGMDHKNWEWVTARDQRKYSNPTFNNCSDCRGSQLKGPSVDPGNSYWWWWESLYRCKIFTTRKYNWSIRRECHGSILCPSDRNAHFTNFSNSFVLKYILPDV